MIVALENLVKSRSSVCLKAASTLWILENEAAQEQSQKPTERGLYILHNFGECAFDKGKVGCQN